MSDIVQGSDAWRQMRLGKVTGSRVADIVSKTKTGYSTTRTNYMAELLCERLTGVPAESFSNATMRWGTETEPFARETYEFYRDVAVTQVPFVDHPRIVDAGASPDGLVGDDGLVEIKCPLTATHIETLLADIVPTRYQPQIQFQLACTGRKFCDFVSFDPRLPEEMRLFVKRVERDEVFIATLESEVQKFLHELEEKVKALRARFGQERAA